MCFQKYLIKYLVMFKNGAKPRSDEIIMNISISGKCENKKCEIINVFLNNLDYYMRESFDKTKDDIEKLEFKNIIEVVE